MRTIAQNDPLTDAEFDRLGKFLEGCKGGRAMNVEQLDGFFAALIAGPETVMPSEYLSFATMQNVPGKASLKRFPILRCGQPPGVDVLAAARSRRMV
jgi:hypothetical protein